MTSQHVAGLWEKVLSQAASNPAMYGSVDFDMIPERFTVQPGIETQFADNWPVTREAVLAKTDKIDLIRVYSMMGDRVADRYAALMGQYDFQSLVKMLVTACDKGIDAVPDAPPELVAFIADMERKPDWLDMDLVEEGARIDRNIYANLTPFISRGAFFATFMNKYSALPMAITNTLSSQTAAKRVKETATFFATTVLPGALHRFGPGFHAVAMVRLMHAMVRANVARRPKDWDQRVYGIPIPQVDQMPAGLLLIFMIAQKALAAGRTQFTADERARLEIARYRCFLLGLPEDLLPTRPQDIVDIMYARAATLRAGFDDATCGELVRATMAADLRPNNGITANVHAFFEQRMAKLYFVQNFMGGSRARAAAVGVSVSLSDIGFATLLGLFLFVQTGLYGIAAHIPVVRDIADRRLVAKLKKQLANNGIARFTTDAAQYRKDTRRELVAGHA